MTMPNLNTNAFTFCPGCGSKGLSPDSEKSFACSRCGFRFFINCAAAAMALILDSRNRLLVTRRKYDPAKGCLDLPGGFAEPGETIEQALAREIREELNLTVQRLSYFCAAANDYPFEGVIYPVADMAFVCEITDFSPMAIQDDVAEAFFVPIPELDPKAFGMASARCVIRNYLKSRSPSSI